jgi:DNA-binding transcriptional regulator GbsR (MarR family)
VSVGKPITASELIAQGGLDELANESGVVSPQKVSALLKKLVDCGKVGKYTDKKKTYFIVVKED